MTLMNHIKHYNCCNKLANDESFICWEPGQERFVKDWEFMQDYTRYAIKHLSLVVYPCWEKTGIVWIC